MGGRQPGRLLVAALLAVVVAGACGGGASDAKRASPRATTSTTVAGAATSTTAATSAGSARAMTSTTTKRSGSTTTTAAATTSSTAATPGLTFAMPGTYRYATTGRFTSTLTGAQTRDGEATVTIDPPSGTDQRSVRTGFGRTNTQVLRLSGGDALLVSLRVTDQGIDKEVRPSPPALALPADAAPGRTWAWKAMSTDGKTTVDSSFRVDRTEELTVGTERVPCLVVEAVLTFTGDVVSTSRQTLWLSTKHRLVIRQDDTTDGRLGLIAFSGASSDTLISLTPG